MSRAETTDDPGAALGLPVYRLRLERAGAVRAARPSCRDPADVAALFRAWLGAADREHFAALFLDVRGRPVGLHVVSVGSLEETPVHPRETFKAALLCNAASVVLVHNHPSGDPSPSPVDLVVTRRLVRAGRLLCVPVMDHVIVGDGAHASLRALGKLEPRRPRAKEQPRPAG